VSTRKIYIRSHPSCQGNHPSGCCSHSAKIAMDTSLLEAPVKRPPISPILLCSANRSTTECLQVAGAAQSQDKKGRPTLGTPVFRNCLGLLSLLHRPGGFSRFTGIFHGGQHDSAFGRWGCTRVSTQVTSSVIINSGGSVFDVIAYGLLHQSYDYCCQLADPDIPSIGRTYSLMVKIRTRNDPPHNGHISDHRR